MALTSLPPKRGREKRFDTLPRGVWMSLAEPGLDLWDEAALHATDRIEPIERGQIQDNFFTPTYSEPPEHPLNFDQILTLAQRRREFHRHLRFESKEGLLDYQQIRTLSVDFGIPFRRFATNDIEVETDKASFFSLMIASLTSEEAMQQFATDEERLFYYRLKFTGVSAVQIQSCFWPSHQVQNLVLRSRSSDDNTFKLEFEDALTIMDPTEAEMQDGIVTIRLENIYHIVCQCFRNRILENMERQRDQFRNYRVLAESLVSEMEKLDHPKFYLTVPEIDNYAAQSFPPCMYRILNSVKKYHYVTFKGRFELCLFLKALGLDYFGQREFWKSMIFSPEDAWYFESQVILVLKQIYGLDEAEDDYAPHRCITMINHDRPFDDAQAQGCPFSFMPKASLKILLKTMRRGVKHADIEELTKYIPDQPTKACTEFFNAKFTNLPLHDRLIERPVDFFFESNTRLSHS